MNPDKEYFRQKFLESQKRFKKLSPDEKLKYLKTAGLMSEKVRSEVLVNLRPGEEFLFFYGAESPFSHWYKCSFTEGSIRFTCVEQYMMYMKARLFQDDKAADEILTSGYSPDYHREQGRKVKNFNQEKWDEYKIAIVRQGNYHKFTQNTGLLNILYSTAPKILVEANPSDLVWGIGLALDDSRRFDHNEWKGENLLGYVLTLLRADLWENREGLI